MRTICRYSKTSDRVVSFTRTIKSKDLIDISGGAPDNSLDYTKYEKSTLVNKILYNSHGILKIRVDYGHHKSSTSDEPPASKNFNPDFHFDKEIEVNGTYVLKRRYCKQRQRRNFIFADLKSKNIHKGTLKAIMDEGKHNKDYDTRKRIDMIYYIYIADFGKQRIRKIRESVPSILGFLEELRRNPNNTQLGM